ncbi:MAG: V-type ATPase 116kDa subunit family protein [bacterium]|nr:V-type ATPase 116kDa subunit family protein [bacterium]
MLKTENMLFTNIYIYENDKNRLVDAIIKCGFVHLVDSDTVNKFLREKSGVYHLRSDISIDKIKTKLYDLMNILDIKPVWHMENKDLDQTTDIDLDEEMKKTENIIFSASQIRNKVLELENDINKYRQMLQQIMVLKEGGYQVNSEMKFEYLYFRVGRISKEYYDKLAKEFEKIIVALFPIQADENDIYLYLFTIKKNKYKVDEILDRYGFSDIKMEGSLLKVSDNVVDELNQKIDTALKEKNILTEKLDDMKKENAEYIKHLFYMMKISDLRNKVKKYFVKTSNILLISGWVLSRKKKEMIQLIEKTVSRNYFLELYTPSELRELDNVPVFYKMPRFFEPFKDLTYNYGIPQYKTVNPIPVVAVTYLLMFGAMFGDIGQGFVLFLLGLIMRRLKRFSSMKSIITMVMYCGLSSMLFGWLFGSFFGYETIIEPLWLKPMNNINTLFGIGIGFGIGLITVGIIINIINALITKDFVKGIFSKFGLLSGIFYWGILLVVSKFFILKEKINIGLIYLILIPIILIFLKEPLVNFIKRKKHLLHQGVSLYIMENVIELFDLIISYVANTMSFIRVIAFGLAHAGLFIAIFNIVDILKRAGTPGIFNILVLIVGNIGIICLEGLVVSIQAMRLEYYEFFGKFFDKTGIPYQPVKLE